jgi:hypothetical protein
MRGGGDVLVVELKRPRQRVGTEELNQVAGYVDVLRDWVKKGNPETLTKTKINPENIKGYLIAYNFKNDPKVLRQMDRLEKDGIHCCKWYDLLNGAEDDHRAFLEIVKNRAPREDPRIRELEDKRIV